MTSKNRQIKEDAIKALSEELQEAKSAFLVDFAKMGIKAQLDLKKRLKDAGGKMLVAKNTLLKIALKEAKLPQEMVSDEVLSGQTALILGKNDPVSPVQAFGKFSSEAEVGQFKAGFVDGSFADKNTLLSISKLPSKETLVGQTVGSIAGPLYGLMNNLQANMQTLIAILSAKTA